MPNNTGKKAAVLAGLTILVGGAETSQAIANTTTPEDVTFQLVAANGTTNTDTLSFSQFNGSLGSLTGVTFSLDSILSGNTGDSINASIKVNGETISSQNAQGLYTDSNINGLVGAADKGFYTGSGNFDVTLSLTCNSCVNADAWYGDNAFELGVFTGLTLTYDFTPATATPIPPALPLFATGLGGLGVAAWRRRKQKSTK